MASSRDPDQNVINFATDRTRTGDTYVSELLKGLVASFKELERKNRELEQRNAELVSALQQSNEKIARLEQFPGANPELSKMALKAAAEILESAEEAVDAVRMAAKAQANDRYRETTDRLLELQKQMLSLLEATREENARRDREANEQALNILLGSKKSILSMAEELDSTSEGSKIRHVPFKQASYQATGNRHQESEPITHNREPKTRHSALGTQDSAPDSEHSEPETQSSGLRTEEQGPSTKYAQTVELIASSFHNFSSLYRFQQALMKLPGVIEVKAQSFEKGTLHLRIKRLSIHPLSIQLSELSDFPFDLVSEDENRIEIRLLRLG